MKINDLELIKDIDILYNNKVILYGAGGSGIDIYKVLKRINVSVAYFCDGDVKKQGASINGVGVISPEELKNIDEKENIVIIISIKTDEYFDEIIDVIEKLELRTKKIFSSFGFDISYIQNFYKLRFNPEELDIYEKTYKFTQNCKRIYSLQFIDSVVNYVLRNLKRVFVYQPGKVGSTTITTSLSNVNIDSCHFHEIAACKKVPDFGADYLYELKNFIKNNSHIRIITLVREPIARSLSMFFQWLPHGSFNSPTEMIKLGETLDSACVRFLKEELTTAMGSFNLFNWFDLELKETFDIDVFEYPFDRKKGYTIIKQDNIEMLLMKLEKLNTLESVIGEFVGAPDFKLVSANEGDKKISRFLYAGVKEKIKIPREIFDFYYKNNPRMDHFYTEEEQKAFLKKWEKNIGD